MNIQFTKYPYNSYCLHGNLKRC